MMAYLYIRGQQDPIEITKEDGLVIKKMLDSDKPFSTIVPLANASWKLSEIKGVKFEQETINNKDFNKMLEEERLHRVEFLKWMPRAKAEKNLQHFELFYYIYTGNRPDKMTKERALSRLEEFFKNNSTWAMPSIKVYKKLMEGVKTQENTQWTNIGLKALEETEFKEFAVNKWVEPIIS